MFAYKRIHGLWLWTLIITCLLLFSGSIFSCKKIVYTIPIKRIPNDLRAYWDFKKGSYWVYMDSATGKTDSVSVFDYSNKVYSAVDSVKDSVAYEYFERYEYHSLESHDHYYSYTIDMRNKEVVIGRRKDAPYGLHFQDIFFMYPFVTGTKYVNTGVYPTDTITVNNIYSTYKSYNSVVEITNRRNRNEGSSLSRALYAKNIGLIRFEVPDSNKVRTLVSYHIN